MSEGQIDAVPGDPGGSPAGPRTDLRIVLGARSAVVVGASDRRGVQVAAIDNLVAGPGEVWGLHPSRAEVRGMRCFPGAASLPAAPDVALLLVGHRHVLTAAEEALAAGARSLVIPGLGNEAGSEGREMVAGLADLAARYDVPTVGVNCMGVVVPGGLSPWIGTLGRRLRRGSVAAVVQSGSVGEALAALGPRVGFRCIASVGAETTRDVADWVACLVEDEGTAAIALFLESVRRPAALRQALERAAAAGKPVVCLRVGRSAAGARAAVAHTDAILTPARAFAALAHHAGLIEVCDFEELVETLEVLGSGAPVRGKRLAAVTQSGGQAALLADLAGDAGICLPQFDPALEERLRRILPAGMAIGNPLDAWAIDDTADVYRRVFAALVESGQFDTVLVQLDQSPFIGQMEAEVSEKLSHALVAAADGRTAVAILSGQATEPVEAVRRLADENGVPVLRGVRPALRALALVGGWSAVTPRLEPSPAPVSFLQLPDRDLGEVEAAAVLARFGVSFAAVRRVGSAAEAREAAARLGYPVVVKVDRVEHRAAQGGVVVGVGGEAELEAALARIDFPALVAEQVPAGPEVYCGAHHHADYGPIVCVGWGGLLVEQAPAVVCALAPLDPEEALHLAGGVPGLSRAISARLQEGLAAALVGIGRFAVRLPVGSSAEINPVILSEERGPIAVDALITRAGERGEGTPGAE